MTTTERFELGTVGTVVDARVSNLQARLLHTRRDPSAQAALARLRRGVGKEPGHVLDILEYTIADEFVDERNRRATERNELAAHVALTLYASHQQSRLERMHRRGEGLGTAMRALHTGPIDKLPPPLISRFRMLGTADTFGELSYHLRGAVQLLRAGGRPLDYGRLADELVRWQQYGPDRVQLTWGRQFYLPGSKFTDKPTPDPTAREES